MIRIAPELLEYTLEQMASIQYMFEHRTSRTYFTRKSPLGFKTTLLLILNMVKKATAVEVANYFYRIDEVRKTPTRQAFSQAREKISHLAIKDFFEKSCELAISAESPRTYKSHRILAIDGTSFIVGLMEKLKNYFGESTTVEGKAMCRIGGVVDVLNDCIIDAEVEGFKTGERALAIRQIEKLKAIPNAIYLFDRGYWSEELVAQILSNRQKFLMRLASNTGKTEVADENGDLYDLRRYSFTLPSGIQETLLTNLTQQEMSDDELAQLYSKRWGIETKYLELKARLQIDKFSGESENVVLQDIYATLYISNLVAFLCLKADEEIREKKAGSGNKYEQKANRSFCISMLRQRFIDLCLLADPAARAAALRRLYDDISSNVSYVGKSKPRPRDKRKMHSSRSHYAKPIL